MSYALYLDPSKSDFLWQSWPSEAPALAYYRLTDLSNEQLRDFHPRHYPTPAYSIAEIHPKQWEVLDFPVDRLSIILDKSGFSNLTAVREKLKASAIDITFEWDHRFNINYYIKLINYWLYCGVTHFSFYNLTDFAVWQRLQQFLLAEKFVFYDRFHACLPGHESRYQKHLARSGNLIAIGGWSRWTDGVQTKTRGPKDQDWTLLTAAEAERERLLFALSDREGLPVSELAPRGVIRVVNTGYAVVKDGQLCPTDKGLWDNVELVARLLQDQAVA